MSDSIDTPASRPKYVYPHSVKWSDLEEFLVKIGLDPVEPSTLRSIEIAPSGVRFRRLRRLSGTSNAYLTAPTNHGGEPAEQSITCRIVWGE